MNGVWLLDEGNKNIKQAAAAASARGIPTIAYAYLIRNHLDRARTTAVRRRKYWARARRRCCRPCRFRLKGIAIVSHPRLRQITLRP
ncbi:hypothetical protein N9L68_06050 [bacterium]|nr:hypothetical protein [bacterium]